MILLIKKIYNNIYNMTLEKFTIQDFTSIYNAARYQFDTNKDEALQTILRTIRNKINFENAYSVYKSKPKSRLTSLTNKTTNETVNETNLINYNDYQNYYVFSDIHADLLVFFVTLLQNNIIGIYDLNTERKLDSKTFALQIAQNYDNYDLCDNILTKYNIKLEMHNSCLIILGDIIDGKRLNLNVQNKYGLNEIFIHMILYNLRIDGYRQNSLIKIVVGNHDFIPLFRVKNSDLYDTTKNVLFNNIDCETLKLLPLEFRNNLLIPFYIIDSSFFELIVKEGEILSLLCHGSFTIGQSSDTVSKSNDNLIGIKNNLEHHILTLGYEKYQKENNISTTQKNKSQEQQIFEQAIAYAALNIVENRHIPEGLDNAKIALMCPRIKDYINENAVLIMGHCITNAFISQIRNSETEDDNTCGTKTNRYAHPCISANCFFSNFPKVILVDNGMATPNSGEQSRTHAIITNCEKYYQDKQYVKNEIPSFTEILEMKFNESINHFDFKISRTNFRTGQNINEDTVFVNKYKIMKSETKVEVPLRVLESNQELVQAIDDKLGGGGNYTKYIKYKLKYLKAKGTQL